MSGLDARELLGRVYPYVLSLQLIFGSLQLLDLLRVRYYPMIERRVSFKYFELGFSLVAPMVALMVLWVAADFLLRRWGVLLASAPLFFCLYDVEAGLSVASLSMCLVGLVFMKDRGRFADSLCWVLSFFLGLGVVHWGILRPLGVASPFTGVFNVLFSVHHVLRRAFPVLVLPFLFFWLIKPLLGKKFRFPKFEVGEFEFDDFSWLLVGFSIFLSIYAAVYPYLSTVNLSGVDFGVDLSNYMIWLRLVENVEEGMISGVGAQRLFFFIFYYGFKWMTGFDARTVFQFMPVLLNPLFVTASSYFSWETFRNSRVTAWCAFLSATGMTITIGLYAFFLSNLLALSIVLFSFGLLIRAVREENVTLLLCASLVGCLIVYTHPWTMDQYIVGLVPVVGFILYKREPRHVSKSVFLGSYLGVIGLAEMIKVVVLGSGGGVAVTSTAVRGLVEFNDIWNCLFFCFPYIYGGFVSNLVLLGLTTLGIYMLRADEFPDRYFWFLMFFSSLLYFLSLETNKSRILYNLPFGFFGSIALFWVYEKRGLSHTFFIVVYSMFYLIVSVGSLVW